MSGTSHRLPITFILITLVIDAMGIGLIMPVMPDLIRDVGGGDLAQAAVWGGIMASSFAIMQFLFGPVLGNLGDRFGRRPVLLVSLGAMALDYLIMAVAGTIWLLLAGRIIGGITAATQSTATAYIADISTPEQKAARFGLTGAAFGLGFVLGPVIGGLLGELGPRAPFYAAAALAAANFALGYFALPETVTDQIRRPFNWRSANPFSTFRHLGALPGLRRFLVFFFLYEFAFIVYPATWAYFTQAQFTWPPAMVGLSLAAYGLSSVVVQAGLIRPILRTLGEARTILLGLGFALISLLILGVIKNGNLALGLIPLSAMGGIVVPALQAIMSQRVGASHQGALQGGLTSIRAVAMIASPFVMTRIFSFFTGDGAPVYVPGAAFLLSAALVVVCGIVFVAGTHEPHATDAEESGQADPDDRRGR